MTGIGRLFFAAPVGDFWCGLRGFSMEALRKLDLRTSGMEYALEMVVKATLKGLKITEVPTTLSPDGRGRPPHLRPWRDGWRGLRFMLLFSPRWLFLYPGLLLIIAGLAIGLWLAPGPRRVGHAVLDYHTMLYGAMAILVGFQMVGFAVFTRVFAVQAGFMPADPRLDALLKRITLEFGVILGALLVLAGLAFSAAAVWVWSSASFGPLDPSQTLRIVIPAILAVTLGGQLIIYSFFLAILGLPTRRPELP
jgi:hypothetical protein